MTARSLAIAVVLVVTVAALALLAGATAGMVRVLRLGQPDPGRTGSPGRRTATMLRETLGHTRMLAWSVPGAAHWFVFVAFGALLFTLVEAYGELFTPAFRIPGLTGHAWYGLAIELVAALCGLSILALIGLRLAHRPGRQGRSRFAGSNMAAGYYVEYTIVAILACVFALRGLRVAAGTSAYPAWSIPLSHALGTRVFGGISPGTAALAMLWVATAKILVSMAWFAVIAWNPTMGVAWHRFTAFPNIFFKRHADGRVALGPLRPMLSSGRPVDLEDPGEDDRFGVGAVEDMTWKGLLDLTSCTECGRCQSQCPAWQTGKPLSPKLLITGLRDHAYAKAPYLLAGGDTAPAGRVPVDALAEAARPLVGGAGELGVIDPDVLWGCTSCGACVQECPVDIEHVDHIMDLRRHQTLVESAFPPEAASMLRNLETAGNPWGLPARTRLDWTRDLPFEVRVLQEGRRIPDDVEWLFWVGCAGASEDRSIAVTRAVAELLHAAGVSFAVLGPRETCTGDPARRMGAEHVFTALATENVATLNGAAVRRIVATCPHCFNTIANEYPQLGGQYEVVHHTQLLSQLVEEGRLVPVTPVQEQVTYHDPCYLGRHNNVYTPPREVLGSIPGLQSQEMHRCKERGFCCGAGGSRMWMEERTGQPISEARIDEALSLDPSVVSTACPYCLVMLSDAVTAKQQDGTAPDVRVLDVAQLLARSVAPPAAASGSPPPRAGS